MIRAEVSWWPGNVKPGGHHVHHVVFGVVTMLVSGVSLIAVYEDGTQTTGAVLATFFGIGAALVLDEFALIFYLQDVYWADEGRTSVDAVFVAIAVTGLLLLGLRPLELINVTDFRDSPDPWVRVAIGGVVRHQPAHRGGGAAEGEDLDRAARPVHLPDPADRGAPIEPAERAVGAVAVHLQAEADAPRTRTGAKMASAGHPGQDLRAGLHRGGRLARST